MALPIPLYKNVTTGYRLFGRSKVADEGNMYTQAARLGYQLQLLNSLFAVCPCHSDSLSRAALIRLGGRASFRNDADVTQSHVRMTSEGVLVWRLVGDTRQLCRSHLVYDAAAGIIGFSVTCGCRDDGEGFANAWDERERGVWRLFLLLRLLRRKRKNAVTARMSATGTPTAGPMITARGVE